MMRRTTVSASGTIYPAALDPPIIPLGLEHMTLALFGLAIYLFCVHSFKLPIASAGIGIGVLGVLTAPRAASAPAPVVFFAVFLGWAALGGLSSLYGEFVNQALLDYAKILLIFFVAINATKSVQQLAVLAGLWVLMFGLYPARGTYFNFLSGIGTFGRYGWNFSFANYNDLAAYAILAMALSAFLLAGQFPRWVRTAALASTAGLALLIIITQSRGAFIGLVIAFVFMLLRSRSRTRLIRFGVLAVVGIVLMAPGAVWERFSRMKYLFNTETIAEADGSAEQRYILLQIASAIARDHLATGVGLGAYTEAHGVYAEDRPEWSMGRGNRDAHNMYVSLVAETGLPGLALFLGMLGSTLLRAMRVEQHARTKAPLEAEQLRILRFGLIAYLIAAIFGSFHRVSFLYLYLAVLWSAAELFAARLNTNGAIASVPAEPRRRLRSTVPRFAAARRAR
jgi:putative inorganic carbon (hco3(-)) transporter